MKLTRWYQSNQKPVRSGPYQVSDYYGMFVGVKPSYKWWNSNLQKWGGWTGSIKYCVEVHRCCGECNNSNEQNVRWRGVAK